MALLNYTTTIDSLKTLGEIQTLLAKRGVRSIHVGYDEEGQPTLLSFAYGTMFFNLPSNYKGILNTMIENKADYKKIKVDKKQAIRVAWRIIKVWIQAQLSMVEAKLAELPEVFLPYAMDKNGQTLYNKVKENMKLLD